MNNRRRSFLFVPGNNERMLRKAISPELACDCVIFDLEDAVPLDQKEKARNLISKAVKEAEGNELKKQFCVRINQLDSPLSEGDIRALSKVEEIETLVVPKAEEQGIRNIHKRTGKEIIPIIESAVGFLRIEDIAKSGGVKGLSYGCADMALSMRGTLQSYQRNEYVKTKIVIVARSYRLEPIDQVFFDLNDIEGFRKECIEAKGIGYSGKLLIHPNQIRIANQVFSSWTKEEIEWAKRVVEAYESSLKTEGKGAVKLNGQLVDAVHYKAAKEMLETK